MRTIVPLALLALAACADTVAPTSAARPSIEALSPISMQGTVGTALAMVPTVQVKDPSGQALENVGIEFRVMSGGGSVATPRATTNAARTASAGLWVLGVRSGLNELQVWVDGTFALSFKADARAGAPAEIRSWTREQAGVAGEQVAPLFVEVDDRYGNSVPGIPVVFTVTRGGGLVDGLATTAATGWAQSSWQLGPAAGEQSVTATVAGLESLAFTATALDPATLTWYDLETIADLPPAASYVQSASVGLSESGHFIAETVWNFPAGPSREFGSGRYAPSGATVIFTYYSGGVPEEAVKHLKRLLFMRMDYDWGWANEWVYAERGTATLVPVSGGAGRETTDVLPASCLLPACAWRAAWGATASAGESSPTGRS